MCESLLNFSQCHDLHFGLYLHVYVYHINGSLSNATFSSNTSGCVQSTRLTHRTFLLSMQHIRLSRSRNMCHHRSLFLCLCEVYCQSECANAYLVATFFIFIVLFCWNRRKNNKTYTIFRWMISTLFGRALIE